MRIGLIVRMDNSGLGTLSWEFARHLNPYKVLIVQNGVFHTFPERYQQYQQRIVPVQQTISDDDIAWLCGDIDVLIGIETFYNWDIVTFCKKIGVKTVLITMFEMTQKVMSVKPDLFLCPSVLDFDVMPEPKDFWAIPLATDRLKWIKRDKANIFVHTASHGGMNGRKGTFLVLEAMKHVKSDIKLIISTWSGLFVDDKRIEIRKVNYKNYWQCWEEGDVLIYPQDYNGICLPVQEAFSSGLGVISTDIYPFNGYLPNELLFQPSGMYKTRAAPDLLEVDAARIDPKDIALKIDEIAGTSIGKYSLEGKKYAQAHSWTMQLPKLIKILQKLCKNTRQGQPVASAARPS